VEQNCFHRIIVEPLKIIAADAFVGGGADWTVSLTSILCGETTCHTIPITPSC
jgi:hypothetical protein